MSQELREARTDLDKLFFYKEDNDLIRGATISSIDESGKITITSVNRISDKKVREKLQKDITEALTKAQETIKTKIEAEIQTD